MTGEEMGADYSPFSWGLSQNMIRTLGGIGPHIIHGVISLQTNMNLTFLHFFKIFSLS